MTELTGGEHRAFDVPAWTSVAPGAGPAWLARCRLLPQHEVERVVLARVVRVGAALAAERGHGGDVESAEASVAGEFRGVEEHPASLLVRVSLFVQARNPANHLRHVHGGARRGIHGQQADVGHVAVEALHLRVPDGAIIGVALARDTQDVIVDVGDVAHMVYVDIEQDETPGDDVEHVVGEGVSHVGSVVRRDAAHVHANTIVAWLEGHDRPASGVVQAHPVVDSTWAGGPRRCRAAHAPRRAPPSCP